MEEKDKIKTEENRAQGSSKFEHFFDGGRHDHESIKKVRTSFRVETATCVKIAIAVFAVWLSMRYWPQVAKFIMDIIDSAETLIIGAIIAFLVNILMRSLEKIIFPKAQKQALITARRVICMILAFVLLIGIVALIIWLITPQLVSCIEIIIAEVPPLFNSIIKWLQKTQILPEDIMKELASIDWKSNLTKIFDVLTSGIGSVFDIVVTTVTSVFSGVITALVSLIFAIYILLSKEVLAKQFKRLEKCYLGLSKRRKYNHTLQVIKDSFENFIVGQCKEAVILGVLCAVGMWIFRFPYASMIGALIGFTALIPVAGAYIGAAVGAIMILTESPIKAFFFIIFIVVLQQLEGNLIYPKVVGESIGLPGLWVLAAVTIGGGVMGIPGMLIGVPLVAAIYTLVGEDMDERLAARAAASVPPAEVPVPAEPKPEPIKAEESPKPAKSKKKKKKK
jgi:predicted PurR-regulated permease PerM